MSHPPPSALAVLTGALVSDIVVIALNYSGLFFHSERLTEWYTTYRLGAVIADVSIISIVTLLAQRLSPGAGGILRSMCLAVLLQVVHDVLFYLFLIRVRPRGPMFDLLQRYANEVGRKAIYGDSMMMIVTVLVARGIPRGETTMALLLASYVAVYALYAR